MSTNPQIPVCSAETFLQVGDAAQAHHEGAIKVSNLWREHGVSIWETWGKNSGKSQAAVAAEVGRSEDWVRYNLLAARLASLPGAGDRDLSGLYSLCVQAHKTGSFSEWNTFMDGQAKDPETGKAKVPTFVQAITFLEATVSRNKIAAKKGVTPAEYSAQQQAAKDARKVIADAKKAATPDSIRVLTMQAEANLLKGDGTATKDAIQDLVGSLLGLLSPEDRKSILEAFAPAKRR